MKTFRILTLPIEYLEKDVSQYVDMISTESVVEAEDKTKAVRKLLNTFSCVDKPIIYSVELV